MACPPAGLPSPTTTAAAAWTSIRNISCCVPAPARRIVGCFSCCAIPARPCCFQPSYPLIDYLARLSAVHVVPYALRDCVDHFAIVADELSAANAAASGQARALITVSPNNPTGSVLRSAELALLRRHCTQNGLALIVDEVFSDYLLQLPRRQRWQWIDSVPSVLGEPATDDAQPLTFVLSGLSKVLGLPQLKLGWIHVSGPEPLRSQAQDRLELVADTFLSVSTPVQLAAPALLSQQPRIRTALLAHVQDNLQTLRDRPWPGAPCHRSRRSRLVLHPAPAGRAQRR